MTQPVHFIKADNTGKLSISEEGLKILEGCKTPCAVISIAGLARTGKSYILNRIVQFFTKKKDLVGFKIGSSIDSCTKGIWMWSVPIELNINGQKGNLILLDTEGLASLDENQTHDAKVFTMSILLSSLFIYNSMGTIDESALDRLSLVCELTKYVKAKSTKTDKTAEEEELGQFSPFFMWCLRDFMLHLSHQGKEISSREYLELALTPDPKKSKGQVKQSIRNLFPQRDCVTLVRPVVDEKKIQNMNKVQESDLRGEFLAEIDHMLGLIQKQLKYKSINSTQLNGSMLAEITKSYINAMNTGGVPTISSTWSNVVEIQCHKALETASNFFEGKIQAIQNDVSMDQMNAVFHQVYRETMSLFDDMAIGPKKKEFASKLETNINKMFNAKKKQLEQESLQFCQDLMNKMIYSIDSQITAGKFHSFRDLATALIPALENFLNTAKGDHIQAVYNDFIQKHLFSMLSRIEKDMEIQVNNKMAQLREEISKKELAAVQEIEKYKKDLFHSTTTSKHDKETMQIKITTLEKEINNLNNKLTEFKKTKEVDQKNWNDQKESLIKDHDAKVSALKKDMETKLTQVRDKMTKMELEKNELSNKEKKSSSELNSLHTEHQNKLKKMESDVSSLKTHLETSKKELDKKNLECIKLNTQMDQLTKMNAQLGKEKESSKNETSTLASSHEKEMKKLQEAISNLKTMIESQKKEYEKHIREGVNNAAVLTEEIHVLRSRKQDLETQVFQLQNAPAPKRSREPFQEYRQEYDDDIIDEIPQDETPVQKKKKVEVEEDSDESEEEEEEKPLVFSPNTSRASIGTPLRSEGDPSKWAIGLLKSKLKNMKVAFKPGAKKDELLKIYLKNRTPQ